MRTKLPQMIRVLLPREYATWGLAACFLGVLEGGVVGVLVKNVYAQAATPLWVNLSVAVVSGAPAFANLASLWFSQTTQGKDKVRLITALIVLGAVTVISLAVVPVSALGLVWFTVCVVLARLCWSGVVTLRSSVWRMNYPRHQRAVVTGKILTLMTLIMALSGALFGWLLDGDVAYFRLAYPLAGAAALGAALIYRATPMRRGKRLLVQERVRQAAETRQLNSGWGILRSDSAYRRYMAAMMVFGSGNLMLMAPLVIILNEHFTFSRMQQVLITASVPLVMMAVSIRFWAQLLDRRHILQYRAVQSWSFVLALASFAIAASTHTPALFWLGAVLYGIAFGGAALGWNLGHNDFAAENEATIYMGIHVSLTGLRGLLMPAVGVALYQWMAGYSFTHSPWILWLPFALSFSGAVWFVRMARTSRDLRQR